MLCFSDLVFIYMKKKMKQRKVTRLSLKRRERKNCELFLCVFLCTVSTMLTYDEQLLVRNLSEVCDVPLKFVELVIESEPLPMDMTIQMKMDTYKSRIKFLNDVITTDVPFSDEMEFYAQCLAMEKDVAIDLARLVIKAEAMEKIDEMEELIVRNNRIEFLLKIFSFLMNNQQFY